MNKVDKFNKFEVIFFRIHLSISGFGLLVLGIAFAAMNSVESVARSLIGVVYTLLWVVIVNFIIGVIRLLKYFISFRKETETPTIWRTLVIIVTSPITLGIFFILTLIMSLSLASCTIQ